MNCEQISTRCQHYLAEAAICFYKGLETATTQELTRKCSTSRHGTTPSNKIASCNNHNMLSRYHLTLAHITLY